MNNTQKRLNGDLISLFFRLLFCMLKISQLKIT
uniref:Uncharacterized protein n=1 Tax=Heterorhabditis bacteriophora TaxID=37862 RepID=A0A1I7W600_HETBA